MSRVMRFLLAVGLVFSGLAVAGPADQSVSAAPPFQDRYIIVFNPQVNARAQAALMARNERFSPDHVYEHALKGFSARLNARQAERLAQHPSVISVQPDVEVELATQQIPWGVEHIGTLSNATADVNGVDQRVDIGVAVLDTGISLGHQDLNIAGGYNCMSTNQSAYNDGHGHGTHVAGTIGALDNTFGVVGVAPGTRLYAVKVFNDSGSGSLSTLICGFDWVTANSHIIDVTNLSGAATGSDRGNCGFGFWWNQDALHQAVCATYDAGVTIVVAAGNNSRDASNTVPAAYPQTIAVGATTQNNDRAFFSNFGPRVDIYAPGVNILSTVGDNAYGNKSGTSMASPHVAGAAALYLAVNPGASPDQVLQGLLDHSVPTNFGTRMVHVAGFSPAEPPEPVHDVEVTSISAPDSITQDQGATVNVTMRNNGDIAENVTVTLSSNAANASVNPSQHVINNLGIGQSQTVSFTWTPSTQTAPGGYQLTATASISADDATPANNTRNHAITVLEKPAITSMYVHSLSATGTRGFFGSWLSGQVEIRTQDGGPVQNATVTLRATGPDHTVTGDVTTNSSGVGSFSVWVPRGTYQITVLNVAHGVHPYDSSLNNVTTITVIAP
jgi:subtilisin family serine protease